MNVYFVHLGCAKNQVDSEILLGYMEKEGIFPTNDIEAADILMVNTCAFIESAKKEAIDTILNLASYKNEAKILIVTGCLAQRYKDELIKELPEVDLFLSIADYKNISEILNKTNLFKHKFTRNISQLERIYSTASYYRYVKISEGCTRACAFCAIPLIRGKLKSRAIEEIKTEVEGHVKDGVYEINLISQDTTAYGLDLYKKLAIVDLLKELVKIPGDFKIRLLYLYPSIVTDEFIDFIANNDKIMPYFDIPIQHSEDKLLKAMSRIGKKEFIRELILKIRKKIPHAVIRTTLIVGFPYETREDVENLVEFITEVPFDHLGCFTYSPEEGTKSYDYPQEISEEEKNIRLEMVMKRQAEVSLSINKKHLGQIYDVVVEHYDENEFMYSSRNYMFAPDDVDGTIYFASINEHQAGDIVKIKILDCDNYTLTGEEVYE